jgi:hypothetical protein
MSDQQTTAWDGYPPDPERAGYHWLRRIDVPGRIMPPVIWVWRPEVQAWRWKGEEQMSPAEQAETKAYIAPVTGHDEVERLRAEVASLRLTLGGRTFGPDVPEPIGCPAPGACVQVAEITRLRRGWLRVIQQENSCPATGGGCLAKRCGCVAEMEMLANEQV